MQNHAALWPLSRCEGLAVDVLSGERPYVQVLTLVTCLALV